jgi:hypothetical protein
LRNLHWLRARIEEEVSLEKKWVEGLFTQQQAGVLGLRRQLSAGGRFRAEETYIVSDRVLPIVEGRIDEVQQALEGAVEGLFR